MLDREVREVPARRDGFTPSIDARSSSIGEESSASMSDLARMESAAGSRPGAGRGRSVAAGASTPVGKAGREGWVAVSSSPSGTRTPAPQPVQRIFLPASPAFVANFRRHAGHRNLTIKADDRSASPVVSLGAGTTQVLPHPWHSVSCPTWDHSA